MTDTPAPDPTEAPVADPTVEATTPESAPSATDTAPAASTVATTDADGNTIQVDPSTGDMIPGSVVIPAPAPAPVVDPTPAVDPLPTVLLPTDGNWSPEQIAIAEQIGVTTPRGVGFSPAALETLRSISGAINEIRNWITLIEQTVNSLPPQ